MLMTMKLRRAKGFASPSWHSVAVTRNLYRSRLAWDGEVPSLGTFFMRNSFLAVIGALLLQHAAVGQVQELPVVDFQRYFPHLVAASEEIRDQKSPQGLQWKFITVRDEQDKLVWVTLTRREGQDRIARVFLAKGPLEGSEATFRDAVAKFSETENIKFEIVDLRDVLSFDAFTQRAASIGWGLQALPK